MHFLQDLKFALRSFANAPLFVGVVLLSLVFDISANTAIFSHRSGRGPDAAGKASGAAGDFQRCGSALPEHYALKPDLVSEYQDFRGRKHPLKENKWRTYKKRFGK